ncbi:hypothetical protein EDD21DRAFT_220878 [Dissophora ornata]|nr:hypothetical protein EDD21DRAFT_220878 [Dissophora ornata]
MNTTRMAIALLLLVSTGLAECRQPCYSQCIAALTAFRYCPLKGCAFVALSAPASCYSMCCTTTSLCRPSTDSTEDMENLEEVVLERPKVDITACSTPCQNECNRKYALCYDVCDVKYCSKFADNCYDGCCK